MAKKIDLTAETIRQIATSSAMGASYKDIEAQYLISAPRLAKLLRTDEARAIIEGIQEKTERAAVAYLKSKLCDLVDLTIKVIKSNLEEGNLNAVPLVFKALGVESKNEGMSAQQQTIQVILPNAREPQTIEVSDVEAP